MLLTNKQTRLKKHDLIDEGYNKCLCRLCVCVSVSAGAAKEADSAEHEDITQTEALHLEVSVGLCGHRARYVVVSRRGARGAGRTRQGQEDTDPSL